MKVSKEKAAENRERIIDTAAQLFRERGFDGIGVADLMRSAGLTHGGFYGHFDSKEDLMEQACERALTNSQVRWDTLTAEAGDSSLDAILRSYLSTEHRDRLGAGCLLAALGPDAARQGGPLRHKVTEGFNHMVGLLTRLVPGRSKAARRQKALATYAAMIGGLMLARVVDEEALSEEILSAVAASLRGSS